MIKTALASTALFAAHALAYGSAVVVNDCGHTAYIQNTPGGGAPGMVSKSLAPGASYEQTWTPLSSGGWSIKIAPNANSDWMNDILQYEYTLEGATIWFDISEVNGSPFNGKQHISATKGCVVKQTAYRNPTDDAYGMQRCDSVATIQVNLCSGKGGSPAPPAPKPPHHHHHGHHHHHKKPPPPPPVSSPQESVPPTTSIAPVESTPVTTSTPAATTNWWQQHHTWNGGPPAAAGEKVEEAGGKKQLGGGGNGHKTPATAASPDGAEVTVTHYAYTTLNKYVTKHV